MDIQSNDTKFLKLSAGFARREGLPVTLTACVLRTTERAAYLYGHGTVDPYGHCYCCGRTLTHPGSIELGIGPECLGSWGARDTVLANMTKEQVAAMARDQRVDGWVPKSVILQSEDTDEQIQAPVDHKMLAPKKGNGAGKPAEPDRPRAVKVTYQSSGDPAIKITFPFDRDTLAEVKTLPGRKFHAGAHPKHWSAPLSIEAVEKLREWGFELDETLVKFLDNAKVDISEQPEELNIPGLKMTLRPYQCQGVGFIEARNGRALVADEMGLGKTGQALAWLQMRPEVRPAVVVCPASLKLNWAKEAGMWMDNPRVQVISGSNGSAEGLDAEVDILIINYDILRNRYKREKDSKTGKNKMVEQAHTGWVDYIRDLGPQAVVIDEAHKIKDSRAQQSKAVKRLAKGAPHVLALTGTPIVNRPQEALNAIQLIDRTVIPSPWEYLMHYCNGHHNGFGWDFSGASNTDELHDKLSNTVMIRRKKADVLTELPAKQYSHVPFELSNRKEYNKASADFIEWLRQTESEEKAAKASSAEALTSINGLKQLTAAGKLRAACDWIEDFVESNGKLVVFGIHKAAITAVMERFGDKAVKVDGSVSQAKRQEAVDRFQNDDSVRVFVGNVQAAGVGLTLTAASDVAFLELPWTPGELSQAEDRVHRIGQEHGVNIYYLLAQDTIDEDIAAMLDRKRAVLDEVLDGGQAEETTMISDLMEQYRQAA